MKRVTFYHSVVCPRCHMAGRSLSSLLPDFPDVEVERVEFLANLSGSRQAGVRSIPTLVYGDQRLDGFYLTKRRIRDFLESLE